ncbi:hemin uptake protein HemP [Dyella sp.]|uniref:hemin uptake protein HemP n=1 Tax=Dyella sp. TaxID=1869338 RepID=UPI002D7790A9|nr:hemin uptake protein HemP [Dyella sp.]HET6431731.1 hemin uptake protein HemP [Dyella sp.]
MNHPLHTLRTQAATTRAGSLSLTRDPVAPVRTLSSDQLLDGGRELVIRHQGGEYHLRLTRNDKLILTK